MIEPTCGSVLVIDDDEVVLKLVKRLLRDTSVNVHCAIDCTAAESFLGDNQPELLLVDFRLPECTGIDFLVEMQKLGKLGDARLICWSAAELQPDDALLARKLGVDVMTKDYLRDRERLLDLVRTSVSLPAAIAQ